MRKTLIITLALLLTASFMLPAQARVKLSAGPALGLNIATQTGDAPNFDQYKKSRTALNFGGVFSIAFDKYIALQPEVHISMKGAKWEVTQGTQFEKLTDKYSYLEIPVFVRGSFPTGTLFTPDLFLGPVLGVKLSAKEDYKSNVYQPYSNQTLQTKSIDFGLAFGAGARFTLGIGDAFLNFIYNLGLTNVNDNPQYPYSVKNRTMTFLAGYAFHFKQK